jgi:hypothetical protein
VGLNEQFQFESADLGIVLVEILQSAESAADLDTWSTLTGYLLARTAPPDLIESAYTGVMPYPIALIVDPGTMEVVASCYEDWKVLSEPLEYVESLEYCFEVNTDITF